MYRQLIISLGINILCIYGVQASPDKVYLNEKVGFNVKGYNYAQKSFPCEVDKKLMVSLLDQAQKHKIPVELAGTPEKLRNGIIPVIAIDIEQLALGKEGFNFTRSKNNSLPKIQTTVAIIAGSQVTTAKHTCAFATLNEFTPSSNVLDLGANTTVCKAMQRCIGELSKDIMTWVDAELK